MTKFKVFHFEDNDNHANQFRITIDLVWKILKNPKNNILQDFDENFDEFVDTIEIKRFSEQKDAIEEIENGDTEYHLYILDILDKNNDTSGILIARLIREKTITSPIIGTSSVESDEKFSGLSLNLKENSQLKNPGKYSTFGYLYYSKGHLKNYRIKPDDIAIDLLKLCTDSGIIKPPIPNIEISFNLLDSSDLAIKSGIDLPQKAQAYLLKDTIEAIGIDRIREIIYRISERESIHIKIDYLRSGESGSRVLKVDFDNRQVLVKFSQNLFSLKKELDNQPKIGKQNISKHFLRYSGDLIHSYDNQWHALYGDFLEGYTLKEFIFERSENQEQIDSILSKIFIKTLSGLYEYNSLNESQISDRHAAFFEVIKPNISRRAKILLAMDELSDLVIDNFYGEEEWTNAAALIENLFEKNHLDLKKTLQLNIAPQRCVIHGDFHSRNIMISKDEMFYFIDSESWEVNFWANDVARLIVDIYMLGIAYNSPAQHKWDNMDSWLRGAKEIINLKTLNNHEDSFLSGQAVIALNWFIMNLKKIFNDLLNLKWDFQLALSMEFLRRSYDKKLPTPKRVLSIAVGYEGIKLVKGNLSDQDVETIKE